MSIVKSAVRAVLQLVSRVVGYALQRIGNAGQVHALSERDGLGLAADVLYVAEILCFQVVGGYRHHGDHELSVGGTVWAPLDGVAAIRKFDHLFAVGGNVKSAQYLLG